MAEAKPEYTIRPMLEKEIPAVLDLWRETNLSEGTYTLDTWYKYDPEGFYVAVDKDDAVIGSCAGVLQSDDLAFVGLYVVKSEYQKRGIGRKIWNTVMDRIGERNSGVNPVPEQLANYRDKAGFFLQTSWSSIVCVAEEIDPSQMCQQVPGVQIRPLTSGDTSTLNKVLDYDEDVLGFRRKRLIPLICDQKESVTMVAVRQEDKEVCGYGNIKKNIRGNALVGPLYADNAKIAEALLAELVKAFPLAEELGLEIASVNCNRPAMTLTEKLGFEHTAVARLYNREEIVVKFDKIYGQYNLNFSVF